MLSSCGVQEEPVISEPQSEPEISESSESEPEEQQKEVSETQDDFHKRMEYEDFYTALVEIKGGIILDVQKNIADFVPKTEII